ncbi:MAG TPA: hypothetical protein VHP33_07350 [Polyangiaceae bacterium]|nr:hypothetical protein [Polyangiaceae bacterium]
MVRAAFVGLLSGLCALGACSGKTVEEEGDGGGSGTGNTPSKPAPVPACRTYASTWCTKAFGCYVQVGRLDEGSRQYNVDECTRLIVEKLPCSAATSVGGDYDKCLSQIKGIACSKWDVPQAEFATVLPPSSCDSALGFDE